MRPLQIDVWSDFVCPFCYLAEPGLQKLAAEDGALEVRWRAFELRPDPVPTLDPKGEYLRDAWENSVYPIARERGLTMKLPPVQPRSRLAHETTAYARSQGKAAEMSHAIFRAFFEHGIDIGKVEELARLATEIGLEASAVTAALNTGSHRAQVLEDEEMAEGFELGGVPAIVIRPAGAEWNGAVLVSGAQPYEILRNAVAQVRERSS